MKSRINEKIGAWMIEKGNTRGVLAERLGISKPTLNTRLANPSRWKWNEVCALAEILECNVNELAGIE